MAIKQPEDWAQRRIHSMGNDARINVMPTSSMVSSLFEGITLLRSAGAGDPFRLRETQAAPLDSSKIYASRALQAGSNL